MLSPFCTCGSPVGLSLLRGTDPTRVGAGGGFAGLTWTTGLNWLAGTPTTLGFAAGFAKTGPGGGLVPSKT